MLLPTTLPIAMSGRPLVTAPTDTAISGALVPSATIVSPTTSGERPSDSAMREAPRTSSSAPATSAPRPRTNSSACSSMVVGRDVRERTRGRGLSHGPRVQALAASCSR